MEQGCLSLSVASLSSGDVHMRKAGYHVLSRYMIHLDGARFREKKQVSTFTDRRTDTDDKQTDGRTDGRTEGQTTDGRTDRPTDRQTDEQRERRKS